MFKERFDKQSAVNRQLNASMVMLRMLFLSHRAERDITKNTLRSSAKNIIVNSQELELVDQSDRVFATQEIDQYARKRSRFIQTENEPPTAKLDDLFPTQLNGLGYLMRK